MLSGGLDKQHMFIWVLFGVFNGYCFDFFIKCVCLAGGQKIHMENHICLLLVGSLNI